MEYFRDSYGILYQGDVLDELRKLPDESVNMCVTSPPYWGLRQYLFDGAVRIIPNLDEKKLKYILEELEKYGIKSKK